MKLFQLMSLAHMRTFLTEYHKEANAEFGIPPLGVGKALVVLAKVLKYPNHHKMIHELDAKEQLCTARMNVHTVTYHEKVDDYQWSANTRMFSTPEASDKHIKDLFESEVSQAQSDFDELCEMFSLDAEDDEIQEMNGDVGELVEWIKDDVSTYELAEKIERLSFERAKVTTDSQYLDFDIKETDIIG